MESTMIGGGGGEVKSGALDEEEEGRSRLGDWARRGARSNKIKKIKKNKGPHWKRTQHIHKCIYPPMWLWLPLFSFYLPLPIVLFFTMHTSFDWLIVVVWLDSFCLRVSGIQHYQQPIFFSSPTCLILYHPHLSTLVFFHKLLKIIFF